MPYFLLLFLCQLHKFFIGLNVVKSQFKQATLQTFEEFAASSVASSTVDGFLVGLSTAQE